MEAVDTLSPERAGKPIGRHRIAETPCPRCIRDAHQQNAAAAKRDPHTAQHVVLCAGIEIVQHVEQDNDVGCGVAFAADVAADEARASVERTSRSIDVAMPGVDADIGDRIGW